MPFTKYCQWLFLFRIYTQAMIEAIKKCGQCLNNFCTLKKIPVLNCGEESSNLMPIINWLLRTRQIYAKLVLPGPHQSLNI